MSFWKSILLVLVMGCSGPVLRAQTEGGSSQGTLSPADVQMVKTEAEQGDIKSQYLVGMMYYAGKYQEQNYAEAAKWFRGAAEKGDASSQYMYALMFYGGLGMPVDYRAAADWMTRAAGQGSAEAEADLAKMYFFGKGVNQDAAAAFAWNRKSAMQGNRNAQFQLGQAYRDGLGIPKNQTEALAWYDLAAKAGDANAAKEHDLLAVSIGDEAANVASQRSDELAGQIRKASAPSATPSGVLPQSDIQRLQTSAEQGNVKSQLMLGDMYSMGLGVEKDPAKGMAYYQKAAAQGDPYAQTAVNRNREVFDQLARPPEGDKNPFASPTPAPTATPAGTPALKVGQLEALAENGDTNAQLTLAQGYYKGSFGKVNFTKAAKWFTEAAKEGDAGAQQQLGQMYFSGKGVTQDLALAMDWTRKAANKGDATAQLNMGDYFYQGKGVPKDWAEALAWYDISGKSGNKDAAKKEQSLRETISADVVRQGEERRKIILQEIAVTQRATQVMAEMPGRSKPPITDSSKFELTATQLQDWQKAADQGDAAAELVLGKYYASSSHRDSEKAIKWFRKAAEHGNVQALAALGWVYASNEGVPRNLEEAGKWYRKAADQGDESSQFILGQMYLKGAGVPEDPAEAAKWLTRASDRGNAEAQMQLARLYYQGLGVEKNPEQVLSLTRRAAVLGNAEAQFMMAVLLDQGQKIAPQDHVESLAWCIVAARQIPEAQRELPEVVAKVGPEVTAKAQARSKELLAEIETALQAKKQREDSLNEIAAPIETPKPSASPAGDASTPRLVDPLQWDAITSTLPDLQKLAEGGDVKAQCQLGEYYYFSSHRDVEKAIEWLRKAADQGSVKAILSLALLYSSGDGVSQDMQEAVKWFRRAAEFGDAPSQYALAMLYLNGIGISRDHAEAAKWFTRAAEQDDPQSQFILACLYRDGDGVERSDAQAYAWARKAALLGNTNAQGMVAIFLDAGRESVPQDHVEALAWCKIAAAAGVEGAAKDLPAAEAALGRDATARADMRSKEILREMEAARQAKKETDAKTATAAESIMAMPSPTASPTASPAGASR